MDRILHDTQAGEITQGGIRYILMRPDVLMGIGEHTGAYRDFVGAMAQSAFANAQKSFERYKQTGVFDGADPLARIAEMAAGLGWGAWAPQVLSERETLLRVTNSPFAAAHRAEDPVCGPIVGVLRALYLTAQGEEVAVTETFCASQGHPHCEFRILR
jgi:predicted hydrocarbon binding protein